MFFFLFILGNCTFDQNTFCNWSNDKYTDNFNWLLWQGPALSNGNTGPTSDYSGIKSQLKAIISQVICKPERKRIQQGKKHQKRSSLNNAFPLGYMIFSLSTY